MTTPAGERHATDAPPSVRRCLGAAELRRLRRSSWAHETQARHLVAHLAHPCAECWGAVESLGAFEPMLDGEGLPVEPEGLEPSADPVVLALRTLGGWPPRRWLRPAHRAALDAVPGRLGFLALVLEEAWRVALVATNGAEVLGPWVEHLDAMGKAGDPELDALRARGLAYLADALQRSGDPTSAGAMLEAAERAVSQRPASDLLAARLAISRARIAEHEHHPLARAYLELAADRLTLPTSGDLRAEIYLELAALCLRHAQPKEAGEALGRAGSLLSKLDQPLLSLQRRLFEARWALAMTERSTSWLLRLAGHVLALARWEGARIPAALDAATAREHEALAKPLGEVRTKYSAAGVRQKLGLFKPSGSEDVAGLQLRVLLAGALIREGDTEGAEALLRPIRQGLGQGLLWVKLKQPRHSLRDQLREHQGSESAERLLGPVLQALALLLDSPSPLDQPPKAEPVAIAERVS